MPYLHRAFFWSFLMVSPLWAAPETPPESPQPLPEVCLGKANAPVLIIDYSSLTCNHCAKFYLEVVPKLKTKYITPGHVRLIFRDFPGDQVSLKAHQVAWSKGEMKYLDFVELLYTHQDKWLSAKDPVEALKDLVSQHGISGEQFDATLKNQELLDKIIQARLEGQKSYKITATPTLVINAKIYPAALTLQEIDEIISPLLNPEEDKKTKKRSKKGTKKEANLKKDQETEENPAPPAEVQDSTEASPQGSPPAAAASNTPGTPPAETPSSQATSPETPVQQDTATSAESGSSEAPQTPPSPQVPAPEDVKAAGS